MTGFSLNSVFFSLNLEKDSEIQGRRQTGRGIGP